MHRPFEPGTRVGSQLGTRYSSGALTKGLRSHAVPSRSAPAGVRLFRFEGAVAPSPRATAFLPSTRRAAPHSCGASSRSGFGTIAS